MKVDLVGKVKNTQLPRSKALLPMFEAVVNSFQSIEDAGDRVQKPMIEIVAKRDPVLPGIEVDTEVNGFAITDNGVGFNDANVDSFFTSDTQYKVGRGGKGIGRFIWLKAFDRAEIESHYPFDGKFLKMVFDFTPDLEQVAPRIGCGIQMLFDRACPGGGWNAGNGVVYGAAVAPHADDTAIALLALIDRREHPLVQRAAQYLEHAAPALIAPWSLAWAILALAAHRRPIASLHSSLVALPDLATIEDTSTLAVVCLALDQQRALEAFGVAP